MGRNMSVVVQEWATNRSCDSIALRKPDLIVSYARKYRGEAFEYTYERGKRFRYLRYGFSTKEFGDWDKTWYLGRLNAKLCRRVSS